MEAARLSNRVVLVGGGTGEVGEGIVRVLLQQGATVVVPSRSQAALDGLRARLDTLATERLVTLEGHIGEISDGERLRDLVHARFGRLDGAIASLGGWWQGAPLTRVTLEEWQQVLTNNLTAHFVMARTLLPALIARQGGSYTLLAGAGGEHPVPGSGPVSVAVAGQLMLKRVLVEELRDQPVRVNEIIAATPVITRSRPTGRPDWLTADDIGALAAYLASDGAAHVRGTTFRAERRAQLDGWLAGNLP